MAGSERKRKKKHHPILSGILTFIKTVLLLGIVAVLAGGGYAFYRLYPELKELQAHALETCSSMNEDDFRMVADTEIFDKDGKRIGLINAGHYTYVPFDEISPWLKKGYIAQEDRRFYSHNGVDFIAMGRAVVSWLKNRRVTQGGSTITQQVIKNTYLTQERTIERKLTEIMIAPELEKRFGKDKILEFYCNGNFYAHGCYGVGAASRYYFGKSASDLEPWEAAVLIGISNRPATYEPVGHPENAKKKRNEVLESLYECGDLTESQLKEYQAKPLEIVQEYESAAAENYQASYAIHCAALQLMKNEGFEFQYTFDTKAEYTDYQTRYKESYGEKSEAIRGGGYLIYTTLDSGLQEMLQGCIDREMDEHSDERQDNGKYAMQSAGVIVDNGSNAVVAIVGGRGTADEFNRGFLSTRQPGSSIKPLLDYAPAFETGYYYPSYIINDYEFEDGPKNSGGNYRGPLPIREALNRSLNTVAWQLLEKVGIRNGLSYLGKMQFSSLSWADTTAPAVSIGGFTYGTRVVDMAKGYSTLANGGVFDEQTCLRSIIYEQTGEELMQVKPAQYRVYTEGTAYILTDVLKGTMDKPYGTGRGLDIDGQQAAGKTGTTNDSKDTWFCGYTRYYTAAVWVGYDTPRPMPGIYGATIAGHIWQDAMTRLHEGFQELDWEMPPSVEMANVSYETGVRVSYNSGERDLFNLDVDPAARRAYEDVNGTTEYDPNARRWYEEETLPPETPPETLPPETTAPPEPVTGIHGGPGLTMPDPGQHTAAETIQTVGPGMSMTEAPAPVETAPAPAQEAPAPAAAEAPAPAAEAPAPAVEAPAPAVVPEAPAAPPEPATVGPAPGP